MSAQVVIANPAAATGNGGSLPSLKAFLDIPSDKRSRPPSGDTARPLTPPQTPLELTASMRLPHPASVPSGAAAPQVPWQEVAAAKRAERERILSAYAEWRVPAHAGSFNYPAYQEAEYERQASWHLLKDVSSLTTSRLTGREREIVEHDAIGLVHSIADRRYTSVEVTIAYCKAAAVAQDLTNCATEIFFDAALQRARELDDYFERTGTVIGPMHGLPFSVKDHMLVRGYDTSTGYVAWAGERIADRDAPVVQILRQAGAVLFVKTANPQTLLSLETNNNIYGRTLNPHNRTLTCGGSSGGEGALVASKGSPIGLGSDIGGSIRIPAAHCGLYGFKASVARMPHAGILGSHDGMEAIIGVLGPLSRSARDLALFGSVMSRYESWLLEHTVLHIPWNDSIASGDALSGPLTIAVLWDDGVVAPHAPIVDALRKAVSRLRQSGHEVIDWQPLDHQESWELIMKLYFLDGGNEYWQAMAESGEPPVPQTAWMLDNIEGSRRRVPYDVVDSFKLNLAREAFRAKVLSRWNETSARTRSGRAIDCILSPVAPTLAPPHDSTRWWGYTSYWNLVDYPAAVFPVGKYNARNDPRNSQSVPVHDQPQTPRNDVEKFVASQWVPATYDNAPVSLQLIGRRLHEEHVLGILGRVDRLVNVD